MTASFLQKVTYAPVIWLPTQVFFFKRRSGPITSRSSPSTQKNPLQQQVVKCVEHKAVFLHYLAIDQTVVQQDEIYLLNLTSYTTWNYPAILSQILPLSHFNAQCPCAWTKNDPLSLSPACLPSLVSHFWLMQCFVFFRWCQIRLQKCNIIRYLSHIFLD